MKTTKPILIGMNNPVSSKPGHELFPYPPGCTGHRLLTMLRTRVPSATRQQYLSRFERRNLVPHKIWDRETAEINAVAVERELWGTGRVIVLLGEDVRRAFGHPRSLLHPQVIGGCTWRQVPHPSGRNMWYNDESNRFLVSALLEELFNESQV